MRRFFYNAQQNTDVPHAHQTAKKLSELSVGSVLGLPDDIFHHWCRVLRARVGDQSVLFDGLGAEIVVEIQSIDKKKATASLISHHDKHRTTGYHTTCAIVMSRGDRMDYAIQKSTELGVTAIQLLTSQYGEVRLKANQVNKKLQHWQQVALSACEQCGLNRPPLVLSPLSIEEWLDGNMGDVHESIDYLITDTFYSDYFAITPLSLVLAVPNQDDAAINVNKAILEQFRQHLTPPRFDILIGAEGGLSDKEYSLARQKGYLPWQIGNRILRTETAPVVALTTLMALSL